MRHRLSWGTWLLLLALLSAAHPPGVDERALVKELEQIEQRIADERKGWMQFKLLATTDAERADVVAAFPRDEFVQQLTDVATRGKGTEAAARAWYDAFTLACMLDDRALFTTAIEALLGEYMTSSWTANLSLALTYGTPDWARPQGQDALRRILAAVTDKSVRGYAMAQLALYVGLDDALGEKGRAEAETLLAAIEAEYASDDFIGMNGKQFAAGARNEIQNLRVGQVVPDVEVTDQEGVRFKLSDYRGRVVLLDFWGFV